MKTSERNLTDNECKIDVIQLTLPLSTKTMAVDPVLQASNSVLQASIPIFTGFASDGGVGWRRIGFDSGRAVF